MSRKPDDHQKVSEELRRTSAELLADLERLRDYQKELQRRAKELAEKIAEHTRK